MAYSNIRPLINRSVGFSLEIKRQLRAIFNQVYEDITTELAGKAGEATLASGAGTGITTGTGTVYKTAITTSGDITKTEILIDLTGLNSSAAGDIIGKNATANCHIGRITAAENGTIFAGTVQCLATPAGGEPDVDLYSATQATGTEDDAITSLAGDVLLAAAADWTAGTIKALTAVPAANAYLYLVGSGAGTSATYTAGKFLITLYGYA